MSNKDENGVSRWWLREPVDHADAESDKGGDFVMHSDYRRVVDALKDELAGTIKVREAAFVQIARLKADNANLQRVITAQEKWRTQCDEAEQAYHDLRQVKIDLDAEMYRLKADLDDAVSMIRCYGEILVNAGYPSGDRVVTRENIKRVIADLARVRGQRDRLALGYAATPSALESVGLRIVGGTVEEIGS